MDDGADVWALLPVARPTPTTKEATAAAKSEVDFLI
jgi:hypothetical protein